MQPGNTYALLDFLLHHRCFMDGMRVHRRKVLIYHERKRANKQRPQRAHYQPPHPDMQGAQLSFCNDILLVEHIKRFPSI